MAKIDFPSTSPYSNTPQSNWYTGRLVFKTIPPAPSDRTIPIAPKYHNRPDRMSLDEYGTPAYWWVFMARNLNLIRDPIFDHKAGMQIVIPSLDTIKASRR